MDPSNRPIDRNWQGSAHQPTTVAEGYPPTVLAATGPPHQPVVVLAATGPPHQPAVAAPAHGTAPGQPLVAAPVPVPVVVPPIAEVVKGPPSQETHSNSAVKLSENDALQIWNPAEEDILTGRGAKVNQRLGNKRFRALCFSRKHEFDEANHARKRTIATEIVYTCKQVNQSRFLKKSGEDEPWLEMTMEASIAKACQVMRDYKRPDRMALREAMASSGTRKRERRVESTPMDDVPMMQPVSPFVENAFGVHNHDVLSGRGAFVNGHTGNQRLRKMALERKEAFDAGNFTEKQTLASEIVAHIRSLDPPGRFLRKRTAKGTQGPKGLLGEWEELSDDKAVHKATQVMRDINRPDRQDREVKKKQRKKAKERWSMEIGNDISMAAEILQEHKRDVHGLEETMDGSESQTVQETVAAVAAAEAEAALDRALESTFV